MKEKNKSITTGATKKAVSEHYKPIEIDYALYEQYLEDANLTEAEKKEFLNTLWQLVVGFVDLGFGVHPVQQACEQPLDLDSLDLNSVVTSQRQSVTTKFDLASQKEKAEQPSRRKA